MSYLNNYNYYFDFSVNKSAQGNQSFIYRDLYVNIDSARDQLMQSGIDFNELKLKTSKNVKIELYSALGELIRTVTNTATEFSLSEVSFIKFVGFGGITTYLTY